MDQVPHGDPASVGVTRKIKDHIRVLAFDKLHQLRRIDAGNVIMCVKLYTGHLAQVVDALAVFSAGFGYVGILASQPAADAMTAVLALLLFAWGLGKILFRY